ncbi:unnamed protein product [Anisakis simplex]|uniref:Uncharacterized protein n=1 Tax=Anisakis simplex TaxID=6269 RepID=A0A0M3JBS3_ANISI|nr:unnamed protein product [Anisakis simplex]
MTHPPPLPSAAQHHQQPSSTTPLICSAQYPSTSTHHPFPQNTNTAISTIFAAAPAQNQATPRFYVAQDGAAFDNCFISVAHQQQQNCSQQQQHVINQE